MYGERSKRPLQIETTVYRNVAPRAGGAGLLRQIMPLIKFHKIRGGQSAAVTSLDEHARYAVPDIPGLRQNFIFLGTLPRCLGRQYEGLPDLASRAYSRRVPYAARNHSESPDLMNWNPGEPADPSDPNLLANRNWTGPDVDDRPYVPGCVPLSFTTSMQFHTRAKLGEHTNEHVKPAVP